MVVTRLTEIRRHGDDDIELIVQRAAVEDEVRVIVFGAERAQRG